MCESLPDPFACEATQPGSHSPSPKPAVKRPQFGLRSLFGIQAGAALLLSVALYAGALGALAVVCGTIVGTLTGSCAELIRNRGRTRFLPRRWEIRGATIGAAVSSVGALVSPEVTAAITSIAVLLTLVL